jgi:acetyl/propionyl-CoA carboxylase alpha subunit
MKRAIDEYRILGIETTLFFGKFVMESDAFVSGDYNTHFVQDYFHPEKNNKNTDTDIEQVAAIIAANIFEKTAQTTNLKLNGQKQSVSNWRKNRL